MSAPVEWPTEWRDVLADCLAAVVDAHETVADAAIDWANDAPMSPLHVLDDSEQALREVVDALRNVQRTAQRIGPAA